MLAGMTSQSYIIIVSLLLCKLRRSAFDSILMELLTLVDHKPFMIEYKDVLRRRLEAIIWFLLTLGLAIFIPDILVVMRPLGGVASLFMFTFPGKNYHHPTYDHLIFQDCVC